jgi:hypothetical protein
MLTEFLSVSKKHLQEQLHRDVVYDSVLTTIGMLSTAIFLWVGAKK